MDNKNALISKAKVAPAAPSAAPGVVSGKNLGTSNYSARPGGGMSISEDDELGKPAVGKPYLNQISRKILIIIASTIFVVTTSVAGTIYYERLTRVDIATRNVDAALSHYITLHRSDGKTLPEMALVDTLRQCISQSILLPEITELKAINLLITKAISEAERSCINIEINAAIKDFFFAFEKAAHEEKSEPESTSVQTAFHHILFIITFAQSKKYSIPPEYGSVKYDPNILWTYYEDLNNQRAKNAQHGSKWQY